MITVGELKDLCERVEKEYGSDCQVVIQLKTNSPFDARAGIYGDFIDDAGVNKSGTLFLRGFKTE